MTNSELEFVFDSVAELIDATPKEKREVVLAKLVLSLANEVSLEEFKRALEIVDRG